MKTLTLGLVFLSAVMVFPQRGGDPVNWKSLESDNERERDTAAVSVLKEHASAEREVAGIVTKYLSDGSRKGTVKTAIRLLGELRAEQYVPLLIDNLTFEVFYKDSKRPQAIEDLFPSVGALIKIGIPSIEPILKKVKSTNDTAVLRAATAVFHGVLGDDLAERRLTIELRNEGEDANRRRLSEMLQLLAQK